MDIFTHAMLPLALLVALRRPRAEALAAGLGAAMPDMDVLFTWVARTADPFYAFVHRGWSHTLWGAPLLAVAGFALLSRPVLARRWPRLGAFAVTPLSLAAACAGAWSHLALDALTITGVPAVWPLSAERFTLNLFFFSALYMVPVSGYLTWRLWKGTLAERTLRHGALLLALALVAGGALRAATYPRDLPEGAVVQPTPVELRWVVAEPQEGGWRVREAGPLADPRAGAYRGNATLAAQDAVARAQALGAYVAWSWTNPAPLVNASAIEGGWRVEFHDAVALHRNATGGLAAGALRTPKALVVEVVGDRARVVERPGFFGL